MASALIVASATLTGCGGASSGGSVTLKLVAAEYGTANNDDSSKRYWTEVAKEFHDKNPKIDVDVQVYRWDVVDKKVDQMVQAGNSPDIAQIGSFSEYASKGQLYPVDELLSVMLQGDFVETLAQAGEVSHVQYGIPFVASSRMLFYNADLFAKAGISEPPTDWAELRRDAAKLKAAGVQVPYGLPLGPEEAQAETMMWLLGNNGGYNIRSGSYSIDSPYNVDTFLWLKENLVDPGLTNPDPAKTNRQDLYTAFADGTVGMLNGHPTLVAQALRTGVNYKIAAIPGKSGKLAEPFGVADWMMGFKKNGHRKQIGKFLDFVYANENMQPFLKQHDLLPVTVSMTDAMRADESVKDLWPFLDQLPAARLYPSGDPAWTKVSARIKTEIGKAVVEDPQSVLRELQRYAENEEHALG